MAYKFQNEDLFPRIAAGDMLAANQLCEANLVPMIAYFGKFSNYYIFSNVEVDAVVTDALMEMFKHLRENPARDAETANYSALFLKFHQTVFHRQRENLYGNNNSKDYLRPAHHQEFALNKSGRSSSENLVAHHTPTPLSQLIDEEFLRDNKIEDPIAWMKAVLTKAIGNLQEGTTTKRIAELYYMEGVAEKDIAPIVGLSARPTGQLENARRRMLSSYPDGSIEQKALSFFMENFSSEVGIEFLERAFDVRKAPPARPKKPGGRE